MYTCGWGTRFLTYNAEVSLQRCIPLCWRCGSYGTWAHSDHDAWSLLFRFSYTETQSNEEVKADVFASPSSSLSSCLSPALPTFTTFQHFLIQKCKWKCFLDIIAPIAFFSRKGLMVLVRGTNCIHWDLFPATYVVCLECNLHARTTAGLGEDFLSSGTSPRIRDK